MPPPKLVLELAGRAVFGCPGLYGRLLAGVQAIATSSPGRTETYSTCTRVYKGYWYLLAVSPGNLEDSWVTRAVPDAIYINRPGGTT